MLQKVRKQGIRLWDERTFWYEIIYKSNPYFWQTYIEVSQKQGLNFYKLSHARMFSRPTILFLVSLLFVALLNSIPTYFLNFKFFYHSSLLAFIYAKAFKIIFQQRTKCYRHLRNNIDTIYLIVSMVIIMLVYRHLLTTRLHGKAAI